jgi:hypothetical protein
MARMVAASRVLLSMLCESVGSVEAAAPIHAC